MSKHVKTIVAAAAEFIEWDAATAVVEAEGEAIGARYAEWALEDRQRVDAVIVATMAEEAKVGTHNRTRAHAYHGTLVAEFKEGTEWNMRLSRVRKHLFAAEQAKKAPQKRGGNAANNAAKKPEFTMENLLPSVSAFVELVSKGEKISAAQKKEIRHAANLLLELL